MAGYRAERAVLPSSDARAWVVIGPDLRLHAEASAFVASLRSRDLSVNTERAYAGRVALYLGYCAGRGLPWTDPGFVALAQFRDWLVAEPLPTRGHDRIRQAFRSQAAANAILTAVCQFLRFGVLHGWVPAQTARVLSEPRYLRYLPPGYDAGEDNQYRIVPGRTLRFTVSEPGYQMLDDDQVRMMISLASRSRDKFLVALVSCTGMRIGEALGLRSEDIHFLASSQVLGCAVTGPHVHVRRRTNANGALAKARVARWVPVTPEVAGLYADYQHERDLASQAESCGMVFVNLFRPPLGAPMTYGNARDMFARLAHRAGFTARPHMLRYSAATRWLEAGTGRDVVQALLGHVSPSSTARYINSQELHHPGEKLQVSSSQDRRNGVPLVLMPAL
jgi:integrase/recombinase XerD